MTEELKRNGRYVNRYFCKSCDNRLSFGQKMDSHGVCPYCGANSHCTVVDTNERSVWVEDSPPLTNMSPKDVLIMGLTLAVLALLLFIVTVI